MEVAGFAVGVASLGIEVCKGLITFYQDWKGCPEDVEDACTSIEKLSKTFVLIQKSMSSPGLSPDNVQRIENCLFSCNEGVQKLKRKLGKIQVEAPRTSKERFKAATSRLAYPFKKSVVEKLKETAQELLQHLSLAIQVLQLDVGVFTQASVEIINEKLEKLLSSEDARQLDSALSWLSAPDPTTNHEEATGKHEEGTGLWFLNSDAYQTWLAGTSQRLWLNGKAGCCKTILCSTIIEDLKDRVAKEPGWTLVFFYFSFSDSKKQTYESLLLSFINQLSKGRPLHPELEKARKNQDRTVKTLETVFLGLVRQMGQTIFVLDALDESPEDDGRERVMAGLQRLSQLSSSTNWLITSRNEGDIRDFMATWPAVALAIDETCVNADINLYVAHEIARSRKLAALSTAVKIEIKQTFEKKADGMFRWAYCQLDEIKRLKLLRPKYITNALNAMPRSLDETYERILASFEQIDEVKTALQWLAFSERPLTVSELQEACITNFQSKPYIDDESRDAMDSLTDILSSLIRVQAPFKEEEEDHVSEYTDGSEIDYSNSSVNFESKYANDTASQVPSSQYVIFLAHFSVKEYLVNDRIKSGSASHLALDAHLSHHTLAQSCAAYLITYYDYSSYGSIFQVDEGAFSLLNYSYHHWFDHQRYVESSSDITRFEAKLHIDLLNGSNKYPAFRIGGTPVGFNNSNGEAPLYWACRLGLNKTASNFLKLGMDVEYTVGELIPSLEAASRRGYGDIVEMLINAGVDSDSRASGGSSAIQLAVNEDHEHVVRILLRHGADVNAGRPGFETPLYTACDNDNLEIVGLLLEAGAEVDAHEGGWQTPLCKVAQEGNEKMAELLIRNGANINAQGHQSLGTALSVAAHFGKDKMVEFLIREGADVNIFMENAKCISALHAALREGRDACLKILLENGADVNLLPEIPYTESAACADLLLPRFVKNLSYLYSEIGKVVNNRRDCAALILTDEHGHLIRADGNWREDVPEGKLGSWAYG